MPLTATVPLTPGPLLIRCATAAVPLVWAPFVLLHPDASPYAGIAHGNAVLWLTVHVAQLLLAPVLVIAVWPLLSRLDGAAATVAKVGLVLWLAFFSAFDAIAGIATGRLSQQADRLGGAEGAAVGDAVTDFFANDAFVGGGFSALALLAQPLWLIVAIALTVALRRADARPVTVLSAGVSTLFALHGGPVAAVGLLALAVTLATADLGEPGLDPLACRKEDQRRCSELQDGADRVGDSSGGADARNEQDRETCHTDKNQGDAADAAGSARPGDPRGKQCHDTDGTEDDEGDPHVAGVPAALACLGGDPHKHVGRRDEHAEPMPDVVGDGEPGLGAGLRGDRHDVALLRWVG